MSYVMLDKYYNAFDLIQISLFKTSKGQKRMIQTGPAACLIRKNVMEPGSEDEGRPGRSCDINAGNTMMHKLCS